MAVNFSIDQTDKISKANKQEIIKSLTLSEKVDLLLLKLTRVPVAEKIFFVQNLGIMLKAGVPLLNAMQTLSRQSQNKRFVKILKETSNAVEKGKSLHESLKLNEAVFGELFIYMVEAGEVSGRLESVLEQIYVQMKKQHELVSKVKGALTYPLVVLFAMGGIGIFMLVAVIPKLTDMLKEFNTQLPFATRMLLLVSDTLANHGIVALIIVVILGFIFSKILQTFKGKYYFQSILLKLPVLSPIIKKINLAKFARTMASLLKTDIMIVKSFQITANVLGNLHYRLVFEDISKKIQKGVTINEIMKTYPHLFPPIVTEMIAIGEQTGELDNILQDLAEFYENEVDQIMTSLPSIIEPILILFLGSAVGAMAVAIIMPMYSIAGGT